MATSRPPAQPRAILRGHRTAVHAAAFVRLADGAAGMSPDSRLATGDSDGFVVLWDLAIVRPRAVWRAHTNSILGLAGWDEERQMVTHGRDHRLVVWRVGVADEARLSTTLPLDGDEATDQERPQPWMVHVLEVNTMNFCAFAWCGYAGAVAVAVAPLPGADGRRDDGGSSSDDASATERLVAVPNTLSLEAVDIYHLPTQRRINTVKLGRDEGMVMALALVYVQTAAHAEADGRAATAAAPPSTLVLVAAFENGVAVAATLDGGRADGRATVRYRAKAHSQPVLALDVAPDQSYFLTSAADAVIAKHPMPAAAAAVAATEQRRGPAPATTSAPSASSASSRPVSLLSAALAGDAEARRAAPPSLSPSSSSQASIALETQPLTTVNTRHAGQQSLCLRSDGRLFATAGWDGRVRVYAARSMQEVAVLKWHQAGCFAAAFAPVPTRANGEDTAASTRTAGTAGTEAAAIGLVSTATTRGVSVKTRRLQHAVTAHWLAAGSKDGKVSLWDIF